MTKQMQKKYLYLKYLISLITVFVLDSTECSTKAQCIVSLQNNKQVVNKNADSSGLPV